ncbi:MAG: HEAT repeat domain-containing protein [Peptostreptococcaceae bacterium]|nr:HEAT repeat domain-containing protein [Peptostreptococcaceae bacterium]
MEKIKDPNWYIRHNSAKALVKIGTSRDRLNMILNGNDKYAKEALEYAIEKRVGRYELG